LAGFVTSISTFAPDFSSSGKTVVDLNGGALLPGDVLEYTIDVVNAGNDTAVDVVLEDAIPTGTSYVPGSIEIVSGANAGAKTDAADGDQGEYDAIADTVFVRLGAGADGSNGGSMLVGETAQVKFRVTIDAGASGTISNQAIITASGLLGAPPTDTPTDGNGPSSGQPPTDVPIDACDDDGDCAAPTPFCNVVFTPNACVECLTDANCGALEPTCDATGSCICVPSGAEVCGDGIDNDCNGVADDGCDDDMDGLLDSIEILIGTNPNDADSDDDGVPDGQEVDPGGDADGDGLINALDPDSDNDGLFDGTELGLGCSSPGTNAAAGNCVADADGGQTVTDPLDADTDDGGLADGLEDTNQNGAIDAGEKDPNDGSDDLDDDNDNDGLTDGRRRSAIGTDPNDADSDDDGIDRRPPRARRATIDTDGDGLVNALDPDSDDDGLHRRRRDSASTRTHAGHRSGHLRGRRSIPDTTTDPLDADTDDGGVPGRLARTANGNGARRRRARDRSQRRRRRRGQRPRRRRPLRQRRRIAIGHRPRTTPTATTTACSTAPR
jgi:clumping factor A